jgi:hypothetical protein
MSAGGVYPKFYIYGVVLASGCELITAFKSVLPRKQRHRSRAYVQDARGLLNVYLPKKQPQSKFGPLPASMPGLGKDISRHATLGYPSFGSGPNVSGLQALSLASRKDTITHDSETWSPGKMSRRAGGELSSPSS